MTAESHIATVIVVWEKISDRSSRLSGENILSFHLSNYITKSITTIK